jgi:DNA polymerase-3 subunit epsilon
MGRRAATGARYGLPVRAGGYYQHVSGTLSLFDWPGNGVNERSLGVGPASPAPPSVIDATPAPIAARAGAVVIFDVETTGTDRTCDQIIELCAQFGLADDAPSQTWRFKPSVAISPGAQAVHGITAEALADCPAFADCCDEIASVFATASVIVGYNLAFDIDMLAAEFTRLGRTPVDFSEKTIVDPFRLWQQCEPRSLQHAHQRFVGNRFEAAHSASADVAATGRVLGGMLKAFGLDGQDWSSVASVCDPSRASWVGPSRHLRWENGVIVIGFGKHTGAVLHVLARGPDKSFLRWLVGKDFPTHVIELCQAALDREPDDFLSWAQTRFGQPAPTALPAFSK